MNNALSNMAKKRLSKIAEIMGSVLEVLPQDETLTVRFGPREGNGADAVIFAVSGVNREGKYAAEYMVLFGNLDEMDLVDPYAHYLAGWFVGRLQRERGIEK